MRRALVLAAFLALAMQGLSLSHGPIHGAEAPSCDVCVVSAQAISVAPEATAWLGTLLGLRVEADDPKLTLWAVCRTASSARAPPARGSLIPV